MEKAYKVVSVAKDGSLHSLTAPKPYQQCYQRDGKTLTVKSALCFDDKENAVNYARCPYGYPIEVWEVSAKTKKYVYRIVMFGFLLGLTKRVTASFMRKYAQMPTIICEKVSIGEQSTYMDTAPRGTVLCTNVKLTERIQP
jgi:hypothetical protein